MKSRSGKSVKEWILAGWTEDGLLDHHCGGMGLVVGCPVCGRIWGKFKPGEGKKKRRRRG